MDNTYWKKMSAIHISGVDAVVTLSTSAPSVQRHLFLQLLGVLMAHRWIPLRNWPWAKEKWLPSPWAVLIHWLVHLEGGAKPDPLALIQDISDGLSSSRACCGASWGHYRNRAIVQLHRFILLVLSQVLPPKALPSELPTCLSSLSESVSLETQPKTLMRGLYSKYKKCLQLSKIKI